VWRRRVPAQRVTAAMAWAVPGGFTQPQNVRHYPLLSDICPQQITIAISCWRTWTLPQSNPEPYLSLNLNRVGHLFVVGAELAVQSQQRRTTVHDTHRLYCVVYLSYRGFVCLQISYELYATKRLNKGMVISARGQMSGWGQMSCHLQPVWCDGNAPVVVNGAAASCTCRCSSRVPAPARLPACRV